jgi:hypothetical protein
MKIRKYKFREYQGYGRMSAVEGAPKIIIEQLELLHFHQSKAIIPTFSQSDSSFWGYYR